MKKILLLMAAAFALTAVSCQKETETNEPAENTTGRTIKFVADISNITKTAFDGVNKAFAWDASDWVKFHGTESGDFSEDKDGKGWQHRQNQSKTGERATFEIAGLVGSKITAVYPNDYEYLSYADFGQITGSIPQNQKAEADHIHKWFPLMAVANDITSNNVNNLVFRNVATLLKFTLDPSLEESGAKYVYQVTIATNSLASGKDKFVGAFSTSINETTGELTVTNSPKASENDGTYIDFTPEGTKFTTGVPYYMTVLPATLTNGFKLYIKRNNSDDSDAGQIELTATRPVTFSLNKITDLGTLSASTKSTEFCFATEDVSRAISAATSGQLDAYNIVNPSDKSFTAKLEYYEDDVLTLYSDYGGPDGDPAVSIANGANLYFEGESCDANQIWLRGIPANTTSKERKYKIYLKTAAETVVATVTQAACTETFAFNHAYHTGDIEATAIVNTGETLWFKVQSLTDKAWSWEVYKDGVQQGSTANVAAGTNSLLEATIDYVFTSNTSNDIVTWTVKVIQGANEYEKTFKQYPAEGNESPWFLVGAIEGTAWSASALCMNATGTQYELQIDYVAGQEMKIYNKTSDHMIGRWDNSGSITSGYGLKWDDTNFNFTLPDGTGKYMLYFKGEKDSNKLFFQKL